MKIGDDLFTLADSDAPPDSDFAFKLFDDQVVAEYARESYRRRGACASVLPVTLLPTSEVARLRKCEAVLKDVEWKGDVYDRDNSFEICPCCRAEKDDGHKPNCRLAASLTPSGDGETEK